MDFARREAPLFAATAERLRKTETPAGGEDAEAARDFAEAERTAKVAAARLAVLEKKSEEKADPESIQLLATYRHDFPTYSCRVDPAGSYIFAGALDNDLRRWDLTSGEMIRLSGHHSWIRKLTFAPRTNQLLTAGFDGQLIWWAGRDQSPSTARIVEAHKGFARGIAVSPDGQLVASSGNDSMVRVWSIDGEPIAELSGHETQVYNVLFHPDGKHLVSADLDGVVIQWQVSDWTQDRRLDASLFKNTLGGVRGLDFDRAGKLLVASGVIKQGNSLSGDGQPGAILFDWATGERKAVLEMDPKHRGVCFAIAFDPASQFIVGTGGRITGALWFWKPGESKAFFEYDLPAVGYDLDFHPDGLRLAVARFDESLALYDLCPGVERIPEIPSPAAAVESE